MANTVLIQVLLDDKVKGVLYLNDCLYTGDDTRRRRRNMYVFTVRAA